MNADVVIIGAGPAGIQAAIHASRKKVSVVMFGRIDGSAMHGTHVENYFGFIGMTEGDDMLEAGLEQAKSFGCIHRNCNVTSTEKIDGAVATIMALDRAIRCGNDASASVYDERGILFI